MATCIIPELNLKNIIAELREYAQATNEFADNLEQIEKKYAEIREKQAESEKYQKAFDDGYANGYSQARFDYEPKTGHWIATEDGFECSECGCISRSQADFCQYCVCRMVEPQESEEEE